MSKAFKCDNCGEFYEGDGVLHEIRHGIEMKEYDTKNITIELCKRCSNNLEVMVEMFEKEEYEVIEEDL